MPATAAPLPTSCPNCAAPVHGPYCAQCGQETTIDTPTLRQFGHEYLHNFVSVESRLWRTLRLLMTQPGALTVEFLAGRRRRYVRPLPLYFSLSFVFFLMLTFTASVPKIGPFGADQNPSAPAIIRIDPGDDHALTKITSTANWPKWMEPMVRRYAKSVERLKQDPEQASAQITAAFVAKLPYAMFFLVPGFALLSALLYRQRRRSYAEHLLFALHLHAFVFLSLALVELMPDDASLSFGLLLVWWFYLALALRTVFQGRLLPQLLRGLTLIFGHSLLLGVAMLVLLVLAVPSIA